MIIDKISNVEKYSYIPNMDKIINYLKTTDLKNVSVGKYDLGDSCKVSVYEYETKEIEDDIKFEAHREYLDLQMLISGEENLYFQALDIGEPATPYNDVKDVEFYTAPWYSTLCLHDGNFALIFPNDLHMGSFVAEEKSNVKKLVFKLKI